MSAMLLCIFAFLAGFVDSIVGGGGLIQLPAVLVFAPGLPLATALGTNKFPSLLGTSLAVVQFARAVKLNWRMLVPAAGAALIFSALGAHTVSAIEPALVRPFILALLIGVAIYTLLRKDLGELHAPRLSAGHEPVGGVLVGVLLGFYDGFFGPGTGSFLIFIFVGIFGYSYLNASASAKVVNLATNIAAVLYFGLSGQIDWTLAPLMAVFNVAGSFMGSRLAIAKGSKFVRALFLVVVSALILRLAWQSLGGH